MPSPAKQPGPDLKKILGLVRVHDPDVADIRSMGHGSNPFEMVLLIVMEPGSKRRPLNHGYTVTNGVLYEPMIAKEILAVIKKASDTA